MTQLPKTGLTATTHGLDATFPDYYAEERRARQRVRVRESLKVAGLVLGMAALAGAVRLYTSGEMK
jgi:hypothetical protein